MIKRSTLIATAFLATTAIAGLVAAPGCSGSDDGGGGGTTTTKPGRQPPARPAATPTGGATKWFAVNALKLGLTRKADGVADANAWKDYGFDLDSRATTADQSKTSENSCKRRQGSQTKVLADGNEGIDNNFGQHVMAVIKSLKADAEESVTGAITDGSFTLLMKLENFTTADNGQVKGTLYVANDFNDKMSTPQFTSSETGWKILKDSALSFNGYVAGGYWYSGDFGKGRIELAISLSGADIKLPIDSGIIAFKVGDGSDGTIAGAMNVDALKEALTPVAKRFGICPGNATYDQVVETLTQSADLVSNAPNLQDTTKECNAISIALGFTAKEVGDHTMAPIKTPDTTGGTDECVEGGGDGGTDGGGTETGGETGGGDAG